jgi:predicted  nucleic acid-binding Zn-ribbon protein
MGWGDTGTKRAFAAVPETCPKVEVESVHLGKLLDEAQETLQKYIGAESDARDRLRSALIEAHERIIELESELEDKDKQITKLESWLEDAKYELANKE